MIDYITLCGSWNIMLKTSNTSLKIRFSKLMQFLKSDLTWTAAIIFSLTLNTWAGQQVNLTNINNGAVT